MTLANDNAAVRSSGADKDGNNNNNNNNWANEVGTYNKEEEGRFVILPTKSVGLKRLAELSLQDYQWRSNVWKTNQAEKQIQDSLAKLMGEDQASYVRPMDANDNSIGPLGVWEKSTVEWLEQVIEEEARRASQIVQLGGILVRPMDHSQQDGNLGPLGMLERRVVTFLESISQSERERSKVPLRRPKDMDPSQRGPLGDAELQASKALKEFFDSECIRAQLQSHRQDDSLVRPMDVPGPLGDFEMAVLQVVKAEEKRKIQYQKRIEEEMSKDPNKVVLVRPIRPMDAIFKGPLGELEQQATDFVEKLTQEEKQRLQNIQKYLDESRPMQQNTPTALGILETIVVGIVRAPILLYQIIQRVRTLLESEPLDEEDIAILRQKRQQQQQKGSNNNNNNDDNNGNQPKRP